MLSKFTGRMSLVPRIAVLAAALVLGACVPPRAPPASETGASDPALQGHAQWCNTSPPSGYCSVDDKR